MFGKPYKNKPLVVAMGLCVLSLTAMFLSLTIGKRQEQADFSPPPFDANACVGLPNVSEELGWSELDAQVFKVSVCGVIVPTTTSADIWLTNPESNAVWMKLRILDMNGNILGETGLIKPGEYIKEINLNNVPAVGTPIVLKIMTYEPETYHSAGSISINTAIY